MSKHQKKDKIPSISVWDIYQKASDAYESITEILKPDFLLLSKEETEKVGESLRKIQAILEPYHHEFYLMKIRRDKREKRMACLREGHVYGKWEERTYYEDNINKRHPYTKWWRQCTRCGQLSHTTIKPIE